VVGWYTFFVCVLIDSIYFGFLCTAFWQWQTAVVKTQEWLVIICVSWWFSVTLIDSHVLVSLCSLSILGQRERICKVVELRHNDCLFVNFIDIKMITFCILCRVDFLAVTLLWPPKCNNWNKLLTAKTYPLQHNSKYNSYTNVSKFSDQWTCKVLYTLLLTRVTEI